MLQANMAYAKLETNVIAFSARANMASHTARYRRYHFHALHTQSWRPAFSVSVRCKPTTIA
eukprot:1610611-Prorocentrum_lima.AAC.1